MSPTYDPLSEKQKQLLDRLPFESTIREVEQAGDREDLAYLLRIGLVAGELLHNSVDPANSRYRYTRTAMPLQA
ncbi:hypothetical protein NI454_09145 [Brevundimonas diminuta]|uniref:hypothetical protein n=1 Tax=Brevundimonas diminuta TaxID=293 RepID=UPI002097E605|nr:hypothetical protein [Brevundimonas diminuta]MCO8030116.1 hypothetical protein [Brevundimonas diminuta]